MKKHITILTGLLCLVPTLSVYGETSAAGDNAPLNVMFVIVVDLRAELRPYGCGQMKTPNFDRLAKSSMQFNRAYVQQAICSASRASFLTRRPLDELYKKLRPFRTTGYKSHGWVWFYRQLPKSETGLAPKLD